jgi:hypothetical protein
VSSLSLLIATGAINDAINDKNLDYEIETVLRLPRFGLDLVGLEGWKEKEGWKDGGNQSSSLAIFQSSNDQSKESR